MVSKKKTTVKYPYPTGIQEMWYPHYRYPNDIKKRWHQSNTGNNNLSSKIQWWKRLCRSPLLWDTAQWRQLPHTWLARACILSGNKGLTAVTYNKLNFFLNMRFLKFGGCMWSFNNRTEIWEQNKLYLWRLPFSLWPSDAKEAAVCLQ